MTTYGIIADIHGNLEGLRAVLDLLDVRRVDRIVCLGDVVGYNAESNQCVELLMARGIDTIAGNHDLIAIERLDFDRCADKPAFTLRRTQKDLTEISRRYLAGLPAVLTFEPDVVLIHGGVDDVQEYLTTEARVLGNHARLRQAFPGARICFFGHTHAQTVYELDDGGIVQRPASGAIVLRDGFSYFVNPGSIDASRKPEPRLAECVIFDSRARTVEFLVVPYDAEAVERSARHHGYRMGRLDVFEYRIRRLLWRARLLIMKGINRLRGAALGK